MPLLDQISSNLTLLANLIIVAGAIIGASLWLHNRRHRPTIVIEPVAKEERLGFRITAKGGSVHSPEVVKSVSPHAGIGSMDSRPLPLYDDYGNLLDKDYINADRSFCVFPYIALHRWESLTNQLIVDIREVPNNNWVADLYFDGIDVRQSFNMTAYNFKSWDITLRIQADGWTKAENHWFRFRLGVYVTNFEAFSELLPTETIADEISATKLEDLKVSYRLNIEEVETTFPK